MGENLYTASIKNIINQLVSENTYHESVSDYLVQHLESDDISSKYWVTLLGIDQSIEEHEQAPAIVDLLLKDLNGFGKIINIILERYFESNRPTFLYWVMWFSGFESSEIEVCEKALIECEEKKC